MKKVVVIISILIVLLLSAEIINLSVDAKYKDKHKHKKGKKHMEEFEEVYDRIILNTGEDEARDILEDGGYLFVLCGTNPARIVRINISAFIRVDAITLLAADGEGVCLAKYGQYLYVLCYPGLGNSARVVRVRLDTFKRVDSIVLGANEEIYDANLVGKLLTVVEIGLIPYLYVGVAQMSVAGQGGVARINLNTFQETGILWLGAGEDNTCAILAYGQYLYTAHFPGAPGQIVRVDLPSFTRLGAINIAAVCPEPHDLAALGNYLYVSAYDGATNIGIARINLLTFTLDSYAQIIGGYSDSYKIIIYRDKLYYGYSFAGPFTSPYRPARIVRFDLAKWPTYTDMIISESDAPNGIFGLVGYGSYLYASIVSSPGHVLKILIEKAAPPTVNGSKLLLVSSLMTRLRMLRRTKPLVPWTV